MKRNCFGRRIKSDAVIESNDFLDENGNIDWTKYGIHVIGKGFDDRYPIKTDYVLKPGEKIARFGPVGGRNTTTVGTRYEQISLPYWIDTVEYHEYVVTKDIHVKVIVTKGIAASVFHREGLGVQYLHEKSLAQLLEEKSIKEDKRWILKALISSALNR